MEDGIHLSIRSSRHQITEALVVAKTAAENGFYDTKQKSYLQK